MKISKKQLWFQAEGGLEKHSSNIIIELPEDNPGKAFYKIAELENKYGFLNEGLKKLISGYQIE